MPKTYLIFFIQIACGCLVLGSERSEDAKQVRNDVLNYPWKSRSLKGADHQEEYGNISQTTNQKGTFFQGNEEKNPKYFESLMDVLQGYFNWKYNDTNENYVIQRKGKNSYTLAFESHFGKGNLPGDASINSKDKRKNDFDEVQGDSMEKADYWVDFVFEGSCASTRNRNFQNVSLQILYEIVSNLLFLSNNIVIFNDYSCKTSMNINVSVTRSVYEENEPFLYEIIKNEEFSFKLFRRKFVFVDFLSYKFKIFTTKEKLKIGRGFYVFLSYFPSVVTLIIIIVSAFGYACYNFYANQQENENSDDYFCDAYKEDNVTHNTASKGVKEIDEHSLLTLDYELSSEFFVNKALKKSQSTQVLSSFQGSLESNLENGRESGLSKQLQQLSEMGMLDNIEKNGGAKASKYDPNGVDNTDRHYEEPKYIPQSLASSTESLGVIRVEYIANKDPCFKYETDF